MTSVCVSRGINGTVDIRHADRGSICEDSGHFYIAIFTENRKKNLFLDFAKHSFLAHHMSMVKLTSIFLVNGQIYRRSTLSHFHRKLA